MAIEVADLLRTPGQDNDAGIKTIVHYCRYHDVKTFPVPNAAPTTYAEKMELTGDFVMNTGKKMAKFECTLEKGALDTKGVGSPGSSSAENMLKLFRYGQEASILGWIEEYKNDDMIFIVEDLQGNRRVIGSEGLPAQILPDWEVIGGDAVSSEKYVQINVKSVGRIGKYYTGLIPLTPAV
ncbi:hypothetical protein [Rufibacter soli]